MTPINCPCGSGKSFQICCEPYIKGTQKAPTAVVLMRSRYSAYATQAADYLVATTHRSERKHHSKTDILEWSISNKWVKLEIINTTEKTVEFKAYYTDDNSIAQTHHEKSTFKFEDGSWFYVDGKFY
jgi:SEC-C motif-containing protein